jgi:hypothetical protein
LGKKPGRKWPGKGGDLGHGGENRGGSYFLFQLFSLHELLQCSEVLLLIKINIIGVWNKKEFLHLIFGSGF